KILLRIPQVRVCGYGSPGPPAPQQRPKKNRSRPLACTRWPSAVHVAERLLIGTSRTIDMTTPDRRGRRDRLRDQLLHRMPDLPAELAGRQAELRPEKLAEVARVPEAPPGSDGAGGQ